VNNDDHGSDDFTEEFEKKICPVGHPFQKDEPDGAPKPDNFLR